MKKYLYAIKDKKANVFDAYMILDNDAQAVRAFAQACEKNEVFAKWPEDFEIHKLGEIHKDLGVIVPLKQPQFLAAATSFVVNSKDKNEQTTTDGK